MAVTRGPAFSQLLNWDQVFSLFLWALTPAGTFQPGSDHQCQLPIPLETCFLPGTLLCCSTGQWLGAAKHLDLPLGLAAKMDAGFYLRLGFFLLQDDLGLTRNPQKCGLVATAALGEPTCLSLSQYPWECAWRNGLEDRDLWGWGERAH